MVIFAGFDLVRHRDTDGRYAADLNALAQSLHHFLGELPAQRFWKLPQSIVHADFHQGNLLFRGDQLAGVFDWDYACEHPRLKDVANALIPRCPEAAAIRSRRHPHLRAAAHFEPAWVEAFLSAYEASEPLTDEEWAVLRR